MYRSLKDISTPLFITFPSNHTRATKLYFSFWGPYFVNPFSFEGNSRLQNAQMKLCILEDEEFYSPKSMEIVTFDNDNIFKEFPNMPFHIALDHFNETICREIACQYSEILYL